MLNLIELLEALRMVVPSEGLPRPNCNPPRAQLCCRNALEPCMTAGSLKPCLHVALLKVAMRA